MEDNFYLNVINNSKYENVIECSLEEFAIVNMFNSLSNAVKSIPKDLLSFSTRFVDLIESRGSLSNIKKLKKYRNKSLKLITEENFIKNYKKQIPTIIGLTGTINDLVQILNEEFNWIEKYSYNELDKLDTVIANFIGSEEYRKSFKPSTDYILLDKHNNEIRKKLKSIIDSKKEYDIDSIKNIIGNNANLKEALNTAADMDKVINENFIKNYKPMIDKITNRTEVLIKILNEDKISSTTPVVKNIRYVIQTAADHVTLVSTVYYLYIRTVDVLNEVLEIYDN